MAFAVAEHGSRCQVSPHPATSAPQSLLSHQPASLRNFCPLHLAARSCTPAAAHSSRTRTNFTRVLNPASSKIKKKISYPSRCLTNMPSAGTSVVVLRTWPRGPRTIFQLRRKNKGISCALTASTSRRRRFRSSFCQFLRAGHLCVASLASSFCCSPYEAVVGG